jgi:hypothetical protein
MLITVYAFYLQQKPYDRNSMVVLIVLANLFRTLDLIALKTIWLSNLSILIVPDEGYSRKASDAVLMHGNIR